MFSKVVAQKTNFLEQTKAAREEREHGRQKEITAITIQSALRGYQTRKRLLWETRKEMDDLLQVPDDPDAVYKPTLKPATEVYQLIKKFLFYMKQDQDQQRFEYLCKYLLCSMDSANMKQPYVSCALSKAHVLPWIQQLKSVLWKCCVYLKSLKPEAPSSMKMITVCLHMLITFTSVNSWKFLKGKQGEALKPGMQQLCNNVMGDLNTRGLYPALQTLLVHGLARSRPCFKKASLTAIVTVAIRPLISANFSDNLLSLFLLHVLSVPALIHHVSLLAEDCLTLMMQHRVFTKSVNLLCNEQSTRIIFNALEGNYALCLLANLIQLGNSEMEGLVDNVFSFMVVVTKLLESCQRYVQSKRSNLTHWHPVLGWFSQKTDQSLHEAMPLVERQLRLLWSLKLVRLLFSDLFSYSDLQCLDQAKKQETAQSRNILKKVAQKAAASMKGSGNKMKMDSPTLMNTCAGCALYLTAINTLTQLRLDILAGLGCQDILLPRLWKFICDLGPDCGLKAFTDLLAMRPNDFSHPIFHLLTLACDVASHLMTILDDVELYEQEKPFTLATMVNISGFLNNFIFRVIWHGLLDVKTASGNEVFSSTHTLLMILYERDCRRPYTPKDHWLIKEVKSSSFVSELERGKKLAQFILQRVPHIIPHKDRVILFRKLVQREKEALGLTESACVSPQSTLITVHRSRIVEDGYRQLATLQAGALKGIIRVKFVNEQGLDEAGIDQDGVFKEFLEETIKRVFDPSLNLFKVTSEQKLYPSPTSYVQEDHLALFDFVGKILGKAVYEGIVVDVNFASFFLTQMLGHQHSATYSSLDELPSLDAELYKNLTYVKHYDGDIGDLDLTFSSDEDVMGQLVTHELVPGGKAIPVTNENKISYVHLMAHFRMRVQIREQTTAFIRGFKSIVNSDWLAMFSTPELQKLISGDNTDMDLDDLKKHTQYYGGFHSNHKVISWLWDILSHDFTAQERAMFLKFVTSCSKPPLLGFAHLEPPFSIRCVEVSDDEDTGDTVGSVLKGFFNIRKKETITRLPTSSTCFNLLKLPNYTKKSTLRDKLRYAIYSGTGFELS